MSRFRSSSSSRRRLLLLPDVPAPVVVRAGRGDLPFDPPTYAALRASGREAFAHYFLTFPVSVDNKDSRLNADGTPVDATEYYHRLWLPPGGVESGTTNHSWFGGLVRDRHLLRRGPLTTVVSATTGRSLTYQVQDKMGEVRDAIKAGLDGFCPDIISVPQSTTQEDPANWPTFWRRMIEMMEAVSEVRAVDGVDFRIMLMPDGTTSGTRNAGTLAKAMNYLWVNYREALYTRDGKLVFAPYQPESAPDGADAPKQFWIDTLDLLRTTYKVPIFFLPCYSRKWDDAKQHGQLVGLTDGIARWQDRDPITSFSDNNQNRRMGSFIKANFPGNVWMAGVSVGDERPNQSNFFERNHARQIAASWSTAIGDGSSLYQRADLVQLPTWSDLAEGAHLNPSVNHGWCWLDLSFYYMIRFKTGAFPTIVRDALYLTHRLQPLDGKTGTTTLSSKVAYTGYRGSAVRIGGSPTGGTFTLTLGGATTGAITFSATVSTMISNLTTAIRTLPGMSAATVLNDVDRTNAYTVRHESAFNPATAGFAASGANLTGGTSPAVSWGPRFMIKRAFGQAGVDTVGVAAFVKEPGTTVTVDVGGRTVSYPDLPAGMHLLDDTALLPLGTGLIGVTMTRNGVVVARVDPAPGFAVSTTRVTQDYAYRARKSLPDVGAVIEEPMIVTSVDFDDLDFDANGFV